MERMRRDLYGVSIDDEATRQTIAQAYRTHETILEPHGAVGWAGLERFREAHPALARVTAVSLETAHPAKFPEEVRALTRIDPPLPPSLQGLDGKTEHYRELATDYRAFKDYLLREYRG